MGHDKFVEAQGSYYVKKIEQYIFAETYYLIGIHISWGLQGLGSMGPP